MAVPKRKTSKAKRDSRRAQNMKKNETSLTICSNCGNKKLPHRVCPVCNFYDGKAVVANQ